MWWYLRPGLIPNLLYSQSMRNRREHVWVLLISRAWSKKIHIKIVDQYFCKTSD